MSKLTFTICMILALVIGVVIGIGWMSISHEGLDGEYFRALKTVGGSGVNWIDAIFRYCVVLLVNMAKVIGISYEALNIWVFIIVQPLIILLLFIWVIRLRRNLKR
mgnify:FL=1